MEATDKIAISRTGGLPDPTLSRDSTAFLTIDMQYLDAHRDHGIGRSFTMDGCAEELEDYFTRIETVVTPNIVLLHNTCRSVGIPVIHVRIMGLAEDGSDFSWRFKELGYMVLPESLDSTFLPELEPHEGELIVNKTTTGAFNSTGLDSILRRTGTKTLIVAGVTTNSCVETTVRDAGDRDYQVILVQDGCAAMTPEDHDASLRFIHRNFAVVQSTVAVVQQLLNISDTV